MTDTAAMLDTLDAPQLRELARRLMAEMHVKQVMIDKLTHEMTALRRLKFAAQSEAFHVGQKSLLEETIDTDLEALAQEIERLTPPSAEKREKRQPKRAPLPAHLPRREIHHESQSTTCSCGCQMKRIGEDIAEKLDHQPGIFTVERRVRGKWVCSHCQTIMQVPVAPPVIDKGMPTCGLLAQVLVAKYGDHLPLYRQEGIFERAGMAIARSTLAQWVGMCGVQLQPLVDALREELLTYPVLHADETPVAMLEPGNGNTHRAYLQSYCTTSMHRVQAGVFDFAESCGGRHAAEFLGPWRGTLVCDDYSVYKTLFRLDITEASCMAHARRKFHQLWANNKSQIAEQALTLFWRLYEIECDVQEMDDEQRKALRQQRSRPAADALHAWLAAQRQRVPDGSATAKAIDYCLGRWKPLTRYLDDGALPIDNNWIEYRIRPIVVGRGNRLFAGSLRAGKRAAAVMSLIHSARLNGHDPLSVLPGYPGTAANSASQSHRRPASVSLASRRLNSPPYISPSIRDRRTLTVQ